MAITYYLCYTIRILSLQEFNRRIFPNACSTWDRPKSIAGWTAVASKLSETAPAKWDIPINWLTNVEVWLAGKAEGDMAQGVDNG